MILNIILDFIELFLVSYFISFFLESKHRFMFISISSIINLIVIEIFQSFNIYDSAVAMTTTVINIFLYWVIEKRINFYLFFIAVLAPWISVLSGTIAIGIFTMIFNNNFKIIIDNYYVFIILLSRMVFLLFIITINRFKNKLKMDGLKEQRILLLFIMIAVFWIYYILLDNIVTGTIIVHSEMFIILILLSILFCLVIRFSSQYNKKGY